jgi:hypothetical protein
MGIEAVLAKLNLEYETITNNIINPYYFSDEPNDTGVNTNINDGGDDMYDSANCLNTNLTQLYTDMKEGGSDDDTARANSIPYTHSVAPENNPATSDDWNNDYTNPPMDGIIADGSSYFGAGSQYFTNMYPDMFVMAATGVDVQEFSITGDLGSDGHGADSVETFTLTAKGRQFTVFTKQNYNAGDPSINHFIFVPGNGAGITRLYDDASAYDDHCLQNLTGIDEIYFIVIAKQNSEYMEISEQQIIAQAFLDVAVDSVQASKVLTYINPTITFRVNVIDYTAIVNQNLPDSLEHIILNLENQTVYVPYVDKPLKHGDTFTLYGQKAIKCRQQYIGKLPKVLEIVD